MPILEVPDGEIYYEVHGSGYPLMIFAPGGLRSELSFWRQGPSNPSAKPVWMDPMTDLPGKYRVVAMDQRNADRSRATICASDGRNTYAADHLASADDRGLERFHVMDGCIGASRLAPNIEVLHPWKGPALLGTSVARVTAFLDRLTPH
jgi:pimeloyl-ACP methyl ester carboxylesterase